MSSIVITIETDGAAFHFEDLTNAGQRRQTGREVARLLRLIAGSFEHTGTSTMPRDNYGNIVGTVEEKE